MSIALQSALEVLPRLRSKHFRVLRSVLRNLRRFRYVPIYVISKSVGMKSYHVRRLSEFLIGLGLLRARKREYEGYALTTRGLDVLALRALGKSVDIERIAHRYDVGKEADIHICYSSHGEPYIIKVYRLGRTSFKKVRSVRPGYDASVGGWVFMNINASRKEYEILQRLWNAGVSVPRPLAKAYHIIVMEYVPGKELHKAKISNPEEVFKTVVAEIFKSFYNAGVVHADLSEYNVLLDEASGKVWLIDWPQWLEITHEEAEEYMKRDLENIVRFFCKKYRISETRLWEIMSNVREVYLR